MSGKLPSQVQLEAFNRLSDKIAEVLPPTERLGELDEDDLLGYVWALDGWQRDLAHTWTLRQMELTRVARGEM